MEMSMLKHETEKNVTGIPDAMKKEYETKTGLSYHDVRVNYPSNKPAQLGALAFTRGSRVYIGPGQLQQLPHELVHVAQQKQGRAAISPTRLEEEAEGGRLFRLPQAGRPQDVIQYRRLNVQDINQILQEEGRENNSISEENKGRICVLAGGQFLFKAHIWANAKRIVRLIMSLEPALQDWFLTLLETGNETGFLDQTEAMLEGETDENKIVVFGGGGNPAYNMMSSVSDILRLLSEERRIMMLGLMHRLQEVSTPKGVLSVIEGANMNVTHSVLFKLVAPGAEDKHELQQAAFIKRLELMVQFIMGAADELVDSGENKRIRDVYYIESTGSDPHEGGRHALYLISREDGGRIVYKPRSLQTDRTVAGPGGILSSFDSTRSASDGPATMTFRPVTASDGTQSLRLEQFMHSVGKKAEDAVDWDTAIKFFYKLGQIQTIAEVSGITDLHTDNILFTEKGPIVIDAECSFLDYSGTMIENDVGPLQRYVNSSNTDMAASAFFLRTPEGRVVKSTAAYVNCKVLQDAFNSGKQEQLVYLSARDERENITTARNALKGLDHIRLVPIATKDLGDLIDSYIYYQAHEDVVKCEELIKCAALAVCQGLRRRKWLFAEANRLEFRQDAFITICELFNRAFDNRTIPAFYMDKVRVSRNKKHEIWEIRLDGVAIAVTYWENGLDSCIADRITQNITDGQHTDRAVPEEEEYDPSPEMTHIELNEIQSALMGIIINKLNERLNYQFCDSMHYSYSKEQLSDRAGHLAISISKYKEGTHKYKSNLDRGIASIAGIFQTEHMLAIRICAYAATYNVMLSLKRVEEDIRRQNTVVSFDPDGSASELAERIFMSKREEIRSYLCSVVGLNRK